MARRRTPLLAAPMASADEVEAQFYDALQAGDLERLMAAWADDEDIVCVHPGGPCAVGAAAVRASFAAVFAHGPVPVQAQRRNRLQTAGAAVHHVVERVAVASADGLHAVDVHATNVYLRTALGWRLVAHHASPAPAGGAVVDTPGAAPSVLH